MTEYFITKQASNNPVMKDIDRSAEIGIDSWGTTTNPFEHQTQALKARIFHGANRIEIGFFGQGKGRKEASTPETFGKRERMDMRELAEINEVETTTHASVGAQGLSGWNPQGNSFDDMQRKEHIDEIKRAIHFAAEATTGGAVVFHTGETFRSLYSNFKDEKGNPMFKLHPEEDTREQFLFADPLTRKIFGVSGEQIIMVPEIKKENGKYVYLKDENGKEIVDNLLKERDKIHKGRIPIYEVEKDGSIKVKPMKFNDWAKMREEEYKMVGEKVPDKYGLAKDFLKTELLYQVQFDINYGRLYKGQYEERLKELEKIKKSLDFYKQLKEKVPKEEWWKFEKQFSDQHGLLPPETKDPIEILEKMYIANEAELRRAAEFDILGKRKALEQLDMVGRSDKVENVALMLTKKGMAELGIYAWQMTEKAKKEGQGEDGKLKLKNPIYIAPENVFPETYGSHPDELRKIVDEGRKEMIKELVEKYGFKGREKEAEQIAKEHIKATFDISHANIWRKYFLSKPEESLEERDKRFEKWLVQEAKKLIEDGIVGHLHVSDNFGFNDEHLTAGDGNVPLKEFVKAAKEAGLAEFIVESGSFNPMTSLPDTWMHFDSPVYNLHVPGFKIDPWTEPSIGKTPYGWNNFYRSYFGRTEGPRYLVGETAPSEDFKGAPFYTGMPIE
ncbi:MAG: hypothetical protein QW757_04715 [Candidatus Woesearchaeota archaeon]